jgi:hypothetical protein
MLFLPEFPAGAGSQVKSGEGIFLGGELIKEPIGKV